MAINLTDTGVFATAGRGKNKTVVLDVDFKSLENWARRMRIDTKDIFRRSFGRACSALKGRFRKVVANAGGVEGVPKFKDFEAFTRELRAKTGRSTPMGGVLADKRRIVAFKRNGWQIIGWPDSLENWAVRFQDAVGDPYFNTPQRRRGFHRLGIKDIPRDYAHNPRRIIPEPFGAQVRRHLDEWARGAYYKELARRMIEEAK